MAQTGPVVSRNGLDRHGINTSGTEFWNLQAPSLYEESIRRGETSLAAGGPIVAITGEHTGRSPNDKFFVDEDSSRDHIDWGSVNKSTTPENFDRLLAKLLDFYSTRDAFVQDLHAGADPDYRLNIRVITECAWHSLFARNMFLAPKADELAGFEPEFTVIQAPSDRKSVV